MGGDDDVKRVKRLSRKLVPTRRGRTIPPRGQDPRKARHSRKGDILRALEEEEDAADEEEPGEDPEGNPDR